MLEHYVVKVDVYKSNKFHCLHDGHAVPLHHIMHKRHSGHLYSALCTKFISIAQSTSARATAESSVPGLHIYHGLQSVKKIKFRN
jgi:hypothetical protein